MGLRRERRGGRAFLVLLLLVPVAIAAGIFVIDAQRDAMHSAAPAAQGRVGRERLSDAAKDLAALIQPAINETRQLARLIENARGNGSSREIIKGLAIPSLDLRPEFLGVGVIFEPNGFDGHDADYVGQSPENDGRGRFSAYYYKDPGKPTITAPLDIANAPGAENWYLAPLKDGRPYMLPPFSYSIDGTDVWLSTVSVPIQADGTGIGVARIDFRMTDLLSRIQKLKGADLAGGWIISGDGVWVTHPQTKKIGKPLALYDPGPEGEIEALRRQYEAAKSTLPVQRQAQNGTRYLMMPLPLDGIDRPWLIAVVLPEVGAASDKPQDWQPIAGTIVSVIFVAVLVFLEFWLHGRRKTTAPQSSATRKAASMPTPGNTRVKQSMRQVRREPTVRRR